MKIKGIILSGLIAVMGIGYFVIKDPSFDEMWKKNIEQMTSYILKGEMELRKGMDYQKYDLEVYYQKENEQYKVVLNDPILKQSQSIVKNNEGVFVMTPQLNQIFKFQGSWPNNTKKTYLIQTMDELLKTAKTHKEDGMIIAESDVEYPAHKQYKHQKMIFDNQARIKQLEITNDENEIEVKIVFQQCEWNPKLEKNTFSIPDDFDVKTSVFPQEQLPLYPMEVFGAKLGDISYVDTVDGEKIMMNYEGEKSFTLVQSVKEPSENTEMVFMSGDLHENYDLFGVEDVFQFSAFYHGVEFKIYSEELSTAEMIEVLNSVQGVGMK